MQNEIEIIEARPEDAAALIEFTRKVGAETDNLTFGSEGLEVSVEQEQAFLHLISDDPHSLFLCAWKDAELIGSGSLTGMNKRMSHRASLAVSLLSSEWNQGIGSAIMEKLIDHARCSGIGIIELEVRRDNSRAIHLYEKFGFERIGTYPAYFKIGDEYIDFNFMILDLRSDRQMEEVHNDSI